MKVMQDAACRRQSHEGEIKKEGNIMVVVVVVIGGVDNVENSKKSDAAWLFLHFFLNISHKTVC